MKSPFKRIQRGALSLSAVFILSVIGFHYIAGHDWLESIWMVVITISTVGYSEGSQTGPAVQVFTIAVIVLGVSSAVYTCGGFIQLMLEGEVEQLLGKRKMTKEISKLRNHVIVCGFGRLGQDLSSQLTHRGQEFIVIDQDPERTELAINEGFIAIAGDATSEDVLEQARLNSAKALVSALPSDADNVFITLTARNLRPDIQIIAKSEHQSSCRKLRQAGADKIVMPHRVGAQQMERMISRPSTADLVELFAEASHLEMELDEFEIGEGSRLAGVTLQESTIRETFNLLVVGIKDAEGAIHFNPTANSKLPPNSTLLVIGDVGNINRMKQNFKLQNHDG